MNAWLPVLPRQPGFSLCASSTSRSLSLSLSSSCSSAQRSTGLVLPCTLHVGIGVILSEIFPADESPGE